MDAQYESVAALVLAAAACVTDLRSRRIPNGLTFGAAAAALVYHSIAAGSEGAVLAVLGWFIGALLFFPLFALRGMGAGDVKLLAAIGASLGPAMVLWVAVYASIAGGALALVVALSQGYLRTAIRNIGCLLGYWWTVGIRPAPGLTLDSSTAPTLAFAVPICAGLAITLWVR